MSKKIKIGVLFGGKSAEHEIALLSAKNIIDAMDKNKYEITLIGIDKRGEWRLLHDERQYLFHADDPKKVRLQTTDHDVALIPKEEGKQLVSLGEKKAPHALDVIFPVLHGTYGEDGTVQGLLKLAGLPFVGASVLGSAVGMDKDVMKRLLRDAQIPIAKFFTFDRFSKKQISFAKIKQELGLPFFIKPANLGSSVGVTKVKTESDFQPALDHAFAYDNKILIEEFIDGREIECSIIGNENPLVSIPGEVICKDEFYTYEAKYIDDAGTIFKIPADLTPEDVTNVQALAARAYTALCCEGMARVDLFLTKEGKAYVNEINTIPGFTNTSMFPKLWEASGVPLTQVIDQLVELAFERFEREKSLKTTF